MKRLGIFVFYDKEGFVDRYVVYLLSRLKAFFDKLMIICNGKLAEPAKLEQFTKYIYIRPNKGFDAAAWQYAFLDILSQDEISTFDEVILFNDTFYGPIYQTLDVFEVMDQRECDFWGLTSHAESIDPMGTCPYGYWPEHIQTYFVGIRKKLFCSGDFYDYWKNLPICGTFEEVVGIHETRFTKHFQDLGYTWEVYLDMRKIDQREQVKATHYVIEQYQLLAEYRFPFYKRKNLMIPKSHYLEYHDASYVRKSMEYIEKETDYDIGFIIENILRLYNISDLKNILNLSYVLSKEYAASEYDEKKAVAVVYVESLEGFRHRKSYIQNMPKYVDIILLAGGKTKKSDLEAVLSKTGRQISCRSAQQPGNELTAFFIDCREDLKKYEYICFIHDHLKAVYGSYYMNAKSYEESLWENLAADGAYINHVIDRFEKEPYLGVLVPPVPFHGEYFYTLHHRWRKSFWKTQELAGRWKIEKFISKEKEPISFGNAFWCRREALGQIIENFPARNKALGPEFLAGMEKIYPYMAQANGYYTAEIMTEQQAGMIAGNLQYVLKYSVRRSAENGIDIGWDWSSYMSADQPGQWGIKRASKYLVKGIWLKLKRWFCKSNLREHKRYYDDINKRIMAVSRNDKKPGEKRFKKQI